MTEPDLTSLHLPGTQISLRATPKASRNRIEQSDGQIRVYVTAPPDKGKANEAIRKLLAKAIGVPKTRLRLIRGETARDKVFVVTDWAHPAANGKSLRANQSPRTGL